MKQFEPDGEAPAAAGDGVAAPLAGPVLPLQPVPVSRPWGRTLADAWGCGLDFAPCIGEVHHLLHEGACPPGSDRLLLKTLYADAPLSVQVHPDAGTAARLGLAGPGQAPAKDEAWLVLSAAPGARVGLGLREAMCEDELRAAVLDGSIVDALVWHEVRAGDALMVPAGTIHAIGAGVTLFEVQQNLDVTFRLHDHGRGRRLDLDAGLMVAKRERWTPPQPAGAAGPGRETLVSGDGFVMERVAGPGWLRPDDGRPAWMAVISGACVAAGAPLAQGFTALASGAVKLDGDAELLLAQAGPVPQPGLWQPD